MYFRKELSADINLSCNSLKYAGWLIGWVVFVFLVKHFELLSKRGAFLFLTFAEEMLDESLPFLFNFSIQDPERISSRQVQQILALSIDRLCEILCLSVLDVKKSVFSLMKITLSV